MLPLKTVPIAVLAKNNLPVLLTINVTSSIKVSGFVFAKTKLSTPLFIMVVVALNVLPPTDRSFPAPVFVKLAVVLKVLTFSKL